LRGRIESILDYAKVRGWREGENPAAWRGHLQKLLPARAKVAPIAQHPALPFADVPAFVAKLREQQGEAARALEFCILTAARSGEVTGNRDSAAMTWSEIDLINKTWTVPAARMKAGKEHRVPLSPRAVAILESLPVRKGEVVFRSSRGNPIDGQSLMRLIRNMGYADRTDVHGFRSSFRTWGSEKGLNSEAVEVCLAHAVGNKVQQAYDRGERFELRRQIMTSWADYCE
jgi:integrase